MFACRENVVYRGRVSEKRGKAYTCTPCHKNLNNDVSILLGSLSGQGNLKYNPEGKVNFL